MPPADASALHDLYHTHNGWLKTWLRARLGVQLEGLSYVATAERLAVSVTTVKKHMIRAMTQCLMLVED